MWAAGVGVVALIGLTVWLRYRPVGVSSLWLDDAWVAVGSRVPTTGDTVRTGLTSPGFSLLYRGWAAMFGHSATTAQLLALLFAVAAPVALFSAARERGLPPFAALLGGALLATAPAHIAYSTRLKQYTAEAFVTTLVLWAAWRVLDRATDGGRWALFIGIGIVASLVSSVGAVLASGSVVVALAAALRVRPRRLGPPLLATGVYGSIVGVWMLVAVRPNLHSRLTHFWRGYYLDGGGVAGGLGARLQVVTREFQHLEPVVVFTVLGAAAVLVLVRRPLVGLLLVTPTLVAIVLAALTIAPLGTGRTDIYLLPTYALLVAVAVSEVTSLLASWSRLVGVLAVVCALGLALNASPAAEGAYPKEDLTPLVRLVEQRRRPGDPIVVYSSAGYAYGLATHYEIEAVPNSGAATGWAVRVRGPGIVVLPAHRTDPEQWTPMLKRLTMHSRRVWVIGSHLYRDWFRLVQMLQADGYQIVESHDTPGASLMLLRAADPHFDA